MCLSWPSRVKGVARASSLVPETERVLYLKSDWPRQDKRE
jgi:hypothetical protein